MKKFYFLLLIVSYVFSTQLSGQIKSTNYASTNNSNCIAEDGNNIWIGTTGGIVVRDKNGILKMVITEENGLPANNVSRIVVDPFGNKWVAFYYKGGLAKFNGSSWNYISKINNTTLSWVNGIAYDQQGNIWIVTISSMGGYEMLCKYDGANWTVFYIPSGNPNLKSVAIDALGNKWIAIWGDGVYKFRDGVWTHYTSSDGLSSDLAYEVYADNAGSVWVSTSGGADRFNGTAWTNYNSNGLGGGVNSIRQDVAGNYWFATSNSGVVKFNGIATYTSYTVVPDGLVSNTPNYMLVDLQNNKWISSPSGIGKYDNATWKTYTVSSLSSNWTTDIAMDKNNNVWCDAYSVFDGTSWINYAQGGGKVDFSTANIAWIGTNGNGVKKFDGSIWTTYTTANGILSNYIRSIKISPKTGYIWAGTNLGISVYNGTNWTTNYTESNGLNGKEVWSIDFEKNGTAWIGTDSGVCSYDGSTWKYFTTANGLPSISFNSVLVDKNNVKWAGAWGGGLCKYNGGVSWTIYNQAGTGFPINYVRSLTADSLNNIWICPNAAGLIKFDGKNFASYSMANGLADNNTYKVAVDKNNVKWVATFQGISKVTCENPVGKFEFNTACLPADSTHFINKSQKTDATTKYEWDIFDDGSIESTDPVSFSYLFPADNYFPISFYVSNDECLWQGYEDVLVGKKPGLSLSVKKDTAICSGSTLPMISKLTNTNLTASYTYQWSTGSADTQIVVSDKGSYFVSVEESGSGCKSTSDTIKVDVTKPYDSSAICMVTVSTEKNKNMIIWERKSNKDIAFYNIYKVYGTNYSQIGSQSFDSLSVFTDYTSLPDVTPERYAISISDGCKNESAKSLSHQTLLLQTSKSLESNKANLLWKNYIDESGAMQPDSFIIYKGKNKTNMTRIYARPYDKSDIQLYTDISFDGISSYYQIALHFKDICSPAILKAESGPYTQSLSNIAEYKTEKAGLENNMLSASVYPNPFNENINLTYFLENQENVYVEVIDALGTKVALYEYSGQVSGINTMELSLPQLPFGVYTLKIIVGDRIQTLKCVKQ
jgi:ligand-binding sensor domain-containing protein